MVTAGSSGIGVVVVLGVSSKILVHVVMHGAFVEVVKSVVGAVQITVDVSPVKGGVSHEHLHIADPSVSNVESIACSISAVGLVGGDGHPIEVVVGTAPQLKDIEFIVVVH